jgi:hypothetical protein
MCARTTMLLANAQVSPNIACAVDLTIRVATTGTAATPTVAPAGGMRSGCVVAAAIMARPTTGTAVTIEGAGGSAVDAVLGCTAAVGMVGGAKRERDTHPSNSPALVALSETTRFWATERPPARNAAE